MSCLQNLGGVRQLTSLCSHPSHPSRVPATHRAPPPGPALPSRSQVPEVEPPAPTAPQQPAMGCLRPWARYGLLVVAHLLTLGLGAVLFQALEGPPACRLRAELRAELAAFQAEHRACLPPGALEELVGTALATQAHGVSSLGNSSEARNWDLPSALLFTASILTTTGKRAWQPSRGAQLLRPSLPGVPGVHAALPSAPKSQTESRRCEARHHSWGSPPTHLNWCLHFSCQEGCGLPSPTPGTL